MQRRFRFDHQRVWQITAAVTGPPPQNYDFKTRVTGGSRSPLGYPPHVHLRIETELAVKFVGIPVHAILANDRFPI
jgi:hypothetical protein